MTSLIFECVADRIDSGWITIRFSNAPTHSKTETDLDSSDPVPDVEPDPDPEPVLMSASASGKSDPPAIVLF
jgi:hypothetical protein